MNAMGRIITGAALLLAGWSGAALAQQAHDTPVGLWQTIDDNTGKPSAYVRIADNGGELTGTVEKLINPSKPDPKCDACTDSRKGAPVLGLAIMRHVKADGDDNWDGGDILDPKNGKVYRVRLRLEDGGDRLDVRGYIGMPLLGRTQTWVRVD